MYQQRIHKQIHINIYTIKLGKLLPGMLLPWCDRAVFFQCRIGILQHFFDTSCLDVHATDSKVWNPAACSFLISFALILCSFNEVIFKVFKTLHALEQLNYVYLLVKIFAWGRNVSYKTIDIIKFSLFVGYISYS